MGLWGMGDNSKANTISDKEWRSIQSRAAKANPDKMRGGKGSERDAVRGRDNFRQARKGNN